TAERLEQGNGLRKAVLGIGITEEFQVVGIWNAKAERHRADIWRQVQLPREWVLTVEAAGGLQHQRCVGHGEGKDRHTVERLTGRHPPAVAGKAAAGLEPQNVI